MSGHISGDEMRMNVPKHVAIKTFRDKENTPAYQVRFKAALMGLMHVSCVFGYG